ncbi:hypothetical protein AB751O23_CH_00030, partial [Chlamydiales bacterium SCGC AB-751-O23]
SKGLSDLINNTILPLLENRSIESKENRTRVISSKEGEDYPQIKKRKFLNINNSKVIFAVQNQSALVSKVFSQIKSPLEEEGVLKKINELNLWNYLDRVKTLSQKKLANKVHVFVLEKFLNDPEIELKKMMSFLGLNDSETSARVKKDLLLKFKDITLKFEGIPNVPLSSNDQEGSLGLSVANIYGKANDTLSKLKGLNLSAFSFPSLKYEIDKVTSPSYFNGEAQALNEAFEKIFVINLDRSKGRMRSLKAHFNDLGGVKFTRFSAVDGNKITLSKAKEIFPSISRVKGKRIQRDIYSIACFFSHFSIIKHAYRKKLDSVLILEDDVRFSPEAQGYLKSSMGKLPKDWEVFYVGGQAQVPTKRVSFNVLKGYSFGGYAYALSKRGIEKIYKILSSMIEKKERFHAVDYVLQRLAKGGDLEAYLLYPHLAHCSNIISTRQDYTWNVSSFYKAEKKLGSFRADRFQDPQKKSMKI